jgi:hypothetical protein
VRARDAGLISAATIAHSPAWLPLEITRGAETALLRLDEPAYRAASFLDQRLLGAALEHGRCATATLTEAVGMLSVRAHFLFHIGHVGSTLLARLVGEHAQLFALREPGLLRNLPAGGEQAALLHAGLCLLSRTWQREQRAVIKVTSFVNEIARGMLALSAGAAAVCLFVRPLQYLRGILAGPNSRAELAQLAGTRWQRLLRLWEEGTTIAAPGTAGEQIAMSWLCEMATLRAAVRELPAPALWLDFDVFLQAPAAALQAVFDTFGAQTSALQIEQLLHSPLMRQYSKAPEYAYDAALRREVLAQADRDHGAEIRRGMQWLGNAAAVSMQARALLS